MLGVTRLRGGLGCLKNYFRFRLILSTVSVLVLRVALTFLVIAAVLRLWVKVIREWTSAASIGLVRMLLMTEWLNPTELGSANMTRCNDEKFVLMLLTVSCTLCLC